MRKIGLTGGFGSGKSTVGAIFHEQGIPLIDADEIAHEVVAPGTLVQAELREKFGPDFFHADGSLDRHKMAEAVFASPARRACLNRITHPAILQAINRHVTKLEEQKEPLVIIDAALLFETNMESGLAATIVVWAPEEICVERLKLRGIDPREALRRIAVQMPLPEKKARADYLIDNSGTAAETREQVLKLIKRLQSSLS